jgi:hypothetical protein
MPIDASSNGFRLPLCGNKIGTGQKVVRYGGPDGVVVQAVRMIFYRHRVTNQLKILYEDMRR